MRKLLKIVAVVIGLVVLLAIGLVVLAKLLITPERVRQTVLPLAEKSLHRKVELGDIGVSLFSGIELRDLKIYETDGQDLFVSSGLVRLRYQLLPLLAMKVVVDEVRLEKPQIRVIRRSDGQFNFSDLAGAAASAPADEGAKAPPADPTAGKAPIDLLVSQVRVLDGQLLFLDHVINAQAPYRMELSNLQVSADGITLTGSVPLKVSCQLDGSPLDLDGSVDLKGVSGQFDVTLGSLDVIAFKPYFQDKLPGKLEGLKLNLKTSVTGSREAVTAKGTLEAVDLDLQLNALPDAPLSKARVTLGHDLRFDQQQGLLELTRIDLDFNGIKAEASGRLAELNTRPSADLQLKVPKLDLRQAMTAVPRALVAGVADLDPAGIASLEARLAGDLADPLQLLKSADLVLDNVQATAGGQRPSLNGKLRLRGDQLDSDALRLRMGDNTADIDLKGRNLFGKPLVVSADVRSERFLLDPLLGGGAATVETAGSGQPAGQQDKVAAKELGPFDLPVRASGTITLGETVWKQLTVKDFVAVYELRDNILTVNRLDGKIAGGSFSNTAKIDLRKPGLGYDATISLKAIQADPLLTALVPKASGALLGRLDLDLALRGSGTRWETMRKTLAGQGDLLVGEGKLVSPGLVQGLAGVLQLQNLNEISFKDFTGNLRIADGKLLLNSVINGSQIKLSPKGTVGLDGSLDLGLDTRLSPELSGRLDKQGKATRYLVDEQGWSQVPLLLSGSFDAPRFGIDPKGVQAQATRALQGEAERQLDKLLKKRTQDAPADGATPPAEDPSKKLLQDSLKQLFGN